MPQGKIKRFDIAEELKSIYGINKNISNSLTNFQKEELLHLLKNNKTVLELTKSFVAKNKELGNNNRTFGRQRSDAYRKLEDEREKNEKLNNEVSQLKYELIELKNQIGNVLSEFQRMLVDDILTRSEILTFIQELKNSVRAN